jgi:GAF domain-containing protein
MFYRHNVLSKLEDSTHSGYIDERFRITRPDGEIRWVWARGISGRDAEGNNTRLLGTALDVTAQKQAEEQVAANLPIAKSAWAEEEALRKATLSLTQDLHTDKVMAALLRSLADVVPYTCARVIVPEGGPHWLALGERLLPESQQPSPPVPWTFVDDKCGLIRRIAREKRSHLTTKQESDRPTFKGHKHLRSWLSVPIIASGDYLGFLSVGHVDANRLTQEHVRRAELLAIPAAVAIENARLYARSEIFASELTKRLSDLQAAESALLRAEGGPADFRRQV